MEYNQIGYSNIRLPDDRNSSIYQYSSTNRFPDEVFAHEFLHTLERNEQENGNQVANLHDYEQYGYENSDVYGLFNWYSDYMQNTIKNAKDKGLSDFAYSSKPIHESNFAYSIELDYLDEPHNIIEEIGSIWERVRLLPSRFL